MPVPVPSSAPAPARVAWSAFRAGSLRSLLLRSSSRSFSRAVLVCTFACPVRAGAFAARWARRLGVAAAVRRAPGGLWAVSVPVAQRSSRWPAGAFALLPVTGGVRGLRRLLGWSGLGVA
ncbi:MAG: hypothetical protein M5U01_09975 [Ardenticatenaceae bacterium]|nr:hypothetical protein [Ardenticatenaceae bacterium]